MRRVQLKNQKVKQLFVGYESITTDEESRNSALMLLLVISVLLSSAFAIINYLSGHHALGIALGVICLAFVPYLISGIRGNWLPRTREVQLFLAMATFVALFVDGGIGGTGIYWTLIFPFLAFLLAGVKMGWRWVGLFALVCYLSTLLASAGLFEFVYSDDTIAFAPTMMLFFVVIAFGFQFQLEKNQSLLKEAMELLEQKNTFIRKIFGRYMSDAVVERILETPDGINLGGRTLPVTIMFTDLRGFSAISESLPPEQVVEMLNIYLEEMTVIINRFDGTINELMGDGLLVVFGAPEVADDDAERAVACAIEMQLAMDKVNKRVMARGFPELAMGVGINSGQVVAGNVGSDMRTKYAVVGSAVNMAARVESFTIGGQVLITHMTRKQIAAGLKVAGEFSTTFKGIKEPVAMYDIGGIGGRHNLYLPEIELSFEHLATPLALHFEQLKGKSAGHESVSGHMIALSEKYGLLATAEALEIHANLLIIPESSLLPADSSIYAKVMKERDDGSYEINFTFMPRATRDFLGHLERATTEMVSPA